MKYLIAILTLLPTTTFACSIVGEFPTSDSLLNRFEPHFESNDEIHRIFVTRIEGETATLQILESFKSISGEESTFLYINNRGSGCSIEFDAQGIEYIVFGEYLSNGLDIFVGDAKRSTNSRFNDLLQKLRDDAT